MNNFENSTPVKEGLFIIPKNLCEEPLLVVSKCTNCGELHFPVRSICPNCQNRILEKIFLNGRGKIYSFTIVTQQPGKYYKGSVPYVIAWVELPDRIRIQGLIACNNLGILKIGMDVTMIIDTLEVDSEGNKVVCYKFTPVEKEKSE